MSIKLKGLTVTQGGAAHTKQIKTATNFTAKLNNNAKTGTITAEVPAYNTVAAVYYSGDNVHQNGVALMAVKHGTAKKTYDWSTPEKPPTPPTPPTYHEKVNYLNLILIRLMMKMIRFLKPSLTSINVLMIRVGIKASL